MINNKHKHVINKVATFIKQCTILASVVILVVFLASFERYTKPGTGVKTIVINAGHGGKDVGTCGSSIKEKEVALKVALKLGHFIKETFKDVEVNYTRQEDMFVELNDIASHANNHNADLFICIHCNANPNKEIFGAETYVMGLNKSKGNLSVAKRENASILLEDNYQKKYDGFDPNSEEASIIFSMYQNAFLDNSLSFAAKVQEQFKSYAKRTDRGVKQAGFLVLWKTKMPSVLIETGFLSNKEEEKFLGSEKGQNQLAYSIFRAFREYKYEKEGKILTTAEKNEKMPKEWELSIEEIKQMDGVNEEPANTEKTDDKEMKHEVKSDDKAVVKEEEKKNEDVKEIKKDVPENKMEMPEYGLIFKVQLMNSDKKLGVKSHKFKGVDDVQEVEMDGSYRYYAGKFKSIEEATKAQSSLREHGFKDAFMVAFKNGKRITMSEARELLEKK